MLVSTAILLPSVQGLDEGSVDSTNGAQRMDGLKDAAVTGVQGVQGAPAAAAGTMGANPGPFSPAPTTEQLVMQQEVR